MRIRSKPLKGKARILLLSAIILILLSAPALAPSYQKLSLGNDKIRISLGSQPVLDITLLENTDQCLSRCEAILKIHAYQALTLPSQPSSTEKLEFLNPLSHKSLRSHSFEILQEKQYNITIPTYETFNSTCLNSNTSKQEPCTITRKTGEQTETKTKQVWKPLNFWGHTFLPGEHTIKLKGEKIPTLGPNNIDWLLTLKGISLTEWAWWNSTWAYRKQITIQNNNATEILENAYSINLTFNHSLLVQEGKSLSNGNDLRIIFNDTQELDRMNDSTFNSEDTTIFFPLQQNIPPSSQDSTNYFLYYGNLQAGAPPENGSSVYLFAWNRQDLSQFKIIELSPEVTNNEIVFNGTDTSTPHQRIQTKQNFTRPFKMEIKWKTDQNLRYGTTSSPYYSFHNGFNRGINGEGYYFSAQDSFGGWSINIRGNDPFTSNASATLSNTIYRNEIILDKTGLFFTIHKTTDNSIITSLSGTPTFFDNLPLRIEHFDFIAGIQYINITGFIARKFLHPEPIVTLGSEDTGNGTLTITDLIPIQVISNVDLVKGKRTLVRTTLQYLQGSQPTANATITVYLDNGTVSEVASNTFNITHGTKPYDIFFSPQMEGQSINLTAQVSSTVPGFNTTNVSVLVNITKTMEFNVSFISISIDTVLPELHFDFPDNYLQTSVDGIEFLNKTYPIGDDKIFSNIPGTIIGLKVDSFFVPSADELLKNIHKAGFAAGNFPKRTVGIVKNGFIPTVFGKSDAAGIMKPGFNAVVVTENAFPGITHELGHTYGLCDDYNDDYWNNGVQQFGFCPNGDSDNNGSLDQICIDPPVSGGPRGCLTSSLEPLSGQPDETPLRSFMGGDDPGYYDKYWITNDSFEHLLEKFSHFSPIFAEKRILISGKFNKSNNTGSFDTFYTLGSGLAENISEFTDGNFSIKEIHSNGSTLLDFKFNLSFFIFFGNSSTFNETNESSFVFVLPLLENTSKFQLIYNSTLIDEVIISSNSPTITLISPNGTELFNNEIINVSWNASDIDGDNLTFTLLASPDNGSTFNAFLLDFNETSFLVNSSTFGDGEQYVFRVLASDGVNTANDTSDSVFEIDNDLNVTEFNLVYINSTQRIFEIHLNNTLSSIIDNILWTLDVDGEMKFSTIPITLNASENIIMFIYHNYTTTGNKTVIFTAQSQDLSETESILIEVN